MKTCIRKTRGTQPTNLLLSSFMAVIMAICFVSCDKDEPENKDNKDDDKPTVGMVTANELAGEWTLVKDNVLYSKVNSSKQDEVINYSGNTSPKYHFYNVTVSEDGIISMTEISVNGSTIGNTKKFQLEGNELKTLDGDVAGTITHYDKAHSWDNLRIEWNEDFSPISFNAPVISTYALNI